MGKNKRRMRKNEEMFLICPPEVASLATTLHLQGVQFMVTNSSSPSHKLAGALGSSSSSSLSGHPGPLFDRTVMVVKCLNNQGRTQSPCCCQKAISLLARYERRRFGWGRGTCSWCDHAHHGCSFSFRERCAVRSVWGVLNGMTFKPKGVGPSSPGLESSRQLVASSRNFYLWHTFLGRRTRHVLSGLLASYAFPSMVLIQIICTS